MPRILGVDIPNNKQTIISLQYLYGVGPAIAKALCEQAKVNPTMKASELTEANIATIVQILQEHYTVEGDLRRKVGNDIRRLIAIGCYRGTRHRKNLPVRGQRTRTNARTRKGVKKTVGAIRDRTERKTAASAEAAVVAGTKPGAAAPAAAKAAAPAAAAAKAPAKK